MTARRVLLLVLIAAAVSFPLGAARKLWVLDEVRYAAVVEEMHETGRWFAPYLNGQFYDHKPPLYFWLVGTLTAATGQSEFVLYTIAWLLSLACVIATYFLMRELLDEHAAWLAAVVMASSFLYAITTGIARMDFMMLCFMVLGLLAFVRGHSTGKRSHFVWFFVFCALAVLTKGPYGLLLPLIGVLVFLAWERRLGEAASPLFLVGFFGALAIIAAWLAGAVAVEGSSVLDLYLGKQTLGRATGSWAHPEPFWYYAAWLPIEMLPWTAFVPRGFVLMRRHRPTAFRLLLALAATSFVVLSAVSCKIFVYILAIWPPLAAAAAFALCDREGQGRALRIETTVTGALLVAVGTVAYTQATTFFPEKLASVTPLAIVLIGVGAVLVAAAWLPQPPMRRRVTILAVTLVVTGLVFSRLCALVLTPAFNDTMSPASAGAEMRTYADEGYAVASCGIPYGCYNYYAGVRVIPELDAAAVPSFFDENTRAVVAIRGTALDEIRDQLPESIRIEGEHVLERKPHYLLVRDDR
ncbi:MAG: glycosyltransferase family 39 protein [Verrucomicrobia bacterium]|nr:glycosyltransferase family 39 protein [Verrucomicrobiota bacterium]